MPEKPDRASDIARVAQAAERLYSTAEVNAATDRMAAAIERRLADADPLVLGVMIGGIIPVGMLLSRLHFPLQVDYVHASRYRETTRGGELDWLRSPPPTVEGRSVLVVDDVLDHGITLAAIAEACRARGAARVLTAVLVEKRVSGRSGLPSADFCAIQTDDRYLFGFGMDYRGYLRNADGIFAVASQ